MACRIAAPHRHRRQQRDLACTGHRRRQHIDQASGISGGHTDNSGQHNRYHNCQNHQNALQLPAAVRLHGLSDKRRRIRHPRFDNVLQVSIPAVNADRLRGTYRDLIDIMPCARIGHTRAHLGKQCQHGRTGIRHFLSIPDQADNTVYQIEHQCQIHQCGKIRAEMYDRQYTGFDDVKRRHHGNQLQYNKRNQHHSGAVHIIHRSGQRQ